MKAAIAMPQTATPIAPAVSPQYNPPPIQIPTAPDSMMAQGGDVSDSGDGGGSNKFKEFFNDINLLDVAISAFIVGGILYSVHYYRFMMMLEKTGYADLNGRIQKIESDIASAKISAEMNATGGRPNRSNMMRGKRGIVTL